MKLLFFGTGSVAVPVLQRLIDSPHNIVACVTQPDRAAGRGLASQPTPIAVLAARHQLSLAQPARVDAATVEMWRALQPDIGVVVDYGLKLPADVLRVPRHGVLGVHPSLLPKYRGAAPVQWALINGEEMTGVTIFRVVEALDSGDVLLQDMTAIRPDETAIELRDRLAAQGAESLMRGLELIERGPVQWHPQQGAVTLAPKLRKDDGQIDWAQPAVAIVNRIRGVQPWPGASTQWHGKRLKLLQARVAIGCATATPGTIVQATDEGFIVSAREGGVLVTSVQLEGGKAMPASAFTRGHALRVGDTFTSSEGMHA